MVITNFLKIPELFSNVLRKLLLVKCRVSNIFLEPFNLLRTFFYEYRKIHTFIPNVLSISINIDGVNPFKNSKNGFWSILGRVNGLKKKFVFPLAICYGRSKPNDLSFMLESINAINSLILNGLDGINFTFSNIICDLPAKSFVTCITQFNSSVGCDRCKIQGIFNRSMTFPILSCPAEIRTDFQYRSHTDNNHLEDITYESPLLMLNTVDLILNVVIDSMHGLYYGVVKNILIIWKNGNESFNKLSQPLIDQINSRIKIANSFIPNKTFEHKPRDFNDIDSFKAAELRTFLLYISIFALQVIPHHLYAHFMCLTVAVSLLENENTIDLYSDYAHQLFLTFVKQSKFFYGESILTYNFHGILHMADDAKRHGPLTLNSAFNFESFNSKFCKFIRAKKNPLVEFCKRYYETINVSFFCFQSPKCNIFSFIVRQSLVIEEKRDFIGYVDRIPCKKILNGISVFNDPCPSISLSIMKFNKTNFGLHEISKDKLVKKCLVIENEDELLCIPLIHSIDKVDGIDQMNVS